MVPCIGDQKGAVLYCGGQRGVGAEGRQGGAVLRILNPTLLKRSSLLVMPTPLVLWKVSDTAGYHHKEKILQQCNQVTLTLPSSAEGGNQLGHLEETGAGLSSAQKLHPRARLAT